MYVSVRERGRWVGGINQLGRNQVMVVELGAISD